LVKLFKKVYLKEKGHIFLVKNFINRISDIADRKPFHSLIAVLVILNISGIGSDSLRISILALLAVLFSAMTSIVIKYAFRSRRPEHKKHRVIEYGFPSSHTQIAFSIATVYAHYVPPIAIPMFLGASAIAASRTLVKAHDYKDVLGGCVLGVITGLIVVSLA